jgi:phage terminase large subunit
MEYCKATDPSAYDHIWEGLCVLSVEGAIYGEELRALELDCRVTKVDYDPLFPVYTFWDIGDRHTSIWIAQAFPFEYRLVDYIEGEGLSLNQYIKQLQDKPYIYKCHYLPFDAQSPQLSTGKSIEEQMHGAGLTVEIVARLTLTSGINAVRTIFKQCWFDSEKCADGLQGLRHYRWMPLGTLGQEKREPLHDWASHPADAFRYFAVGIRTPRRPRPKSEQPRRISQWS